MEYDFDSIEYLARYMHEAYLEAIKELSPDSYNEEAVKPWSDLTEEQKQISRHIAKRTFDLMGPELYRMIRKYMARPQA